MVGAMGLWIYSANCVFSNSGGDVMSDGVRKCIESLCVIAPTAQAGADMGVNEFCNGFVTCDACVAASVDCFWCPTLGSVSVCVLTSL